MNVTDYFYYKCLLEQYKPEESLDIRVFSNTKIDTDNNLEKNKEHCRKCENRDACLINNLYEI